MITEVKPKFTQDPTTEQQLCIDGYNLFTNIEEEGTKSTLSKFVTDVSTSAAMFTRVHAIV